MARFSDQELKKFESRLNKHKGELQEKKQELKEQDPLSDPDRMLDNTPDADARELQGHDRAAALIREIDDEFEEINQALERITDGSYGVCDQCGNEISKARLKVVSHALLCGECERKTE